MSSGPLRFGFVRRGFRKTGGAERYLLRFAEGLRERGIDTVLFTTSAWPEDAGTFSSIHRLPDGGPLAFADALESFRPRNHCDLLLSLERVWDCDFYRAGDGVHRAWLERRARAERFALGRFRNGTRKHREILRLESHLFARENPVRIIANSELVKYEIVQYYDKSPADIAVIYNGYKPPATEGDPRDRIRGELGLGPEDIFLLFVGSGWQRKGLPSAIRAVQDLRDSRANLFVIGRGRAFGLPRGPVTFLGPRDSVAPFYEAADLFLLPTLYDPFSNACLEASAHGLPVVTTTANGFAEAFGHGLHGEVVEDPLDVSALVAALQRWLDPEKRVRARPHIRKNARQRHVKRNVEETLELVVP